MPRPVSKKQKKGTVSQPLVLPDSQVDSQAIEEPPSSLGSDDLLELPPDLASSPRVKYDGKLICGNLRETSYRTNLFHEDLRKELAAEKKKMQGHGRAVHDDAGWPVWTPKAENYWEQYIIKFVFDLIQQGNSA